MRRESHSQISGSTGAVDASTFDMVWVKAWRAGLEVMRTLSWQDITQGIVVVLFWLAAILSTVFAFAIWLISRVILALYIAVGPLLVTLVACSWLNASLTMTYESQIMGSNKSTTNRPSRKPAACEANI